MIESSGLTSEDLEKYAYTLFGDGIYDPDCRIYVVLVENRSVPIGLRCNTTAVDFYYTIIKPDVKEYDVQSINT